MILFELSEVGFDRDGNLSLTGDTLHIDPHLIMMVRQTDAQKDPDKASQPYSVLSLWCGERVLVEGHKAREINEEKLKVIIYDPDDSEE